MKRTWLAVAIGLALAGSALAQAEPQTNTSTTPSLGDLARKLRAERKQENVKPKAVFTNDNLPARPPEEKLTVASGISSSPSESKQAQTGKETAGKTASGPPAEEAHGEKYFREKADDIRTRLELHQRELSVLEQKLSQGEMQFYIDPQKTLEQTSTPKVNSDVNKLRSAIDNKKQQIADDEKAMDDLRDQLRRDGGDPGWIR